jgi:hypothetical protein
LPDECRVAHVEDIGMEVAAGGGRNGRGQRRGHAEAAEVDCGSW